MNGTDGIDIMDGIYKDNARSYSAHGATVPKLQRVEV